MSRQTQAQFVINRLRQRGQISRNECLQNYITRLGAIICDLKEDGWTFSASYIRNDHGGRDYVYFLQNSPFKKVEYRVEGELVGSRYERVVV